MILPETWKSQTDTANSALAYPASAEIVGQTLEKGVKCKGGEGALQGWYSGALDNTDISLPVTAQGFREQINTNNAV